MRFDVLVNGGAGSVDAAEEEREVAAIAAAFAAAGARAEVRVVEPERMQDEVRACWEGPDRPRAVVVAGGDGTVSCGAGAAAGTDIVLGALPLGTFNHFAKDIDLPAELGAAVAALVTGEVRAIDAAEVNGRVFVNNSVLGLYPDLVAVRDRIRHQRGWGKVRAVPVALITVLRRFPLHRLDLRGPGYERRRVRTPLVFVGNGVFGNESGGAPRRGDLADGSLGVAVSRAKSRWGLVRSAFRALARGADADDDIDTVALTELTVDLHVRHARVAVDGEICWMESPLRYRIRPKALHVLAPAVDTPTEAGSA
jgi:diacylglycerol kinase family enzyme